MISLTRFMAITILYSLVCNGRRDFITFIFFVLYMSLFWISCISLGFLQDSWCFRMSIKENFDFFNQIHCNSNLIVPLVCNSKRDFITLFSLFFLCPLSLFWILCILLGFLQDSWCFRMSIKRKFDYFDQIHCNSNLLVPSVE